MAKKLVLGILGSTKGSDLPAIINAVEHEEINAEIGVIVSDKKNSGILKKAKEAKLNNVFIDPKGKEREQFDQEIMNVLKENKVNLVILIGYMRLFGKKFVKRWGHRCMNVHPSLLPAFAGGMNKNVHKAVLKSGVKVSGCTLHFVSHEADSGPIILQRAVPIYEKDNVNSLKERVQEAEQEILVKGIRLYQEERLEIKRHKVKILESEESPDIHME